MQPKNHIFFIINLKKRKFSPIKPLITIENHCPGSGCGSRRTVTQS